MIKAGSAFFQSPLDHVYVPQPTGLESTNISPAIRRDIKREVETKA
jgi:hypothetical protein